MISTTFIAQLFFSASLILHHQILVASGLQDKSPALMCRPFNKSSGMTELCGYKDTAEYILGLNEFDIAKWLRQDDYFKLSSESCSKTLRLLECGNSFPLCKANVRGPTLPCKRVCHDFFAKCGESLRNSSEWLYWTTRWSCDLLAEKDDPSTMDYKQRCFEPPGFKTCQPKCTLQLEPPKCFPLVVPECQNFGYKFTIFPEKYQKEYIKDGLAFTSKKINNTFCAVLERKFDCTASFPPCFKDDMRYGGSCYEDCISFFDNNCSSSSFFKTKDKCNSFPKRSSTGDVVCKQTEWLSGWPEYSRRSGQSKQEESLVMILIGLLTSTAVVTLLPSFVVNA